MIRLIQRRLIVPRGDTGTFSIPVLAGKNTGDASVFTIFDPLTHRKICEKVMQLSDGVLSMQFSHGDTVNLPVGQYVWDIKFYSDPVIADGHIVGGEEVDSYYAAFMLPVCEIRETGDNLLMDDRTPNAMLAPDQIDLITASLTEIAQAKAAAASSAAEADTSATNAETSASTAAVSAQAALDSQVAALASQQAAQAAATDAANSAATATQKAAQIETDLTNKADKSEIPTLVSQLENDSGYLTQHQDISGKANSADLAAVATSGSYNDLSDKPTIPDIQIDGTSIIDNGIANIPIASSGVPGVVGIDSLGGITVGFNNNLEIHPASNADIKSGNQYLKPIVPSRQDRAVFYGLATAAGADESASQEAFGTYREPAKAAIRNMIGAAAVSDIPDISGKANTTDLAAVATSGSYNDLLNKPTHVSAFTNDAGYLTSFTETDPTVPAWAKASTKPTYTASEVGAPTIQEMNTAIGTAIGNINSFDMAVVQALPSQDISTHTIYLVPKTGETNDVYDEYIYINNAWEMIGNTQIDLSNYALKSEIPEVPVQDVRINNNSILNTNGVANFPVANANSYGVVKVDESLGIAIGQSTGKITTRTADYADIKAGTDPFRPITPDRQERSVFYGLAKAAGDSTQSQSNNAVGTYTDGAKTAIKNMLGVSEPVSIIDDTTGDGDTNKTWSADKLTEETKVFPVDIYINASLTEATCQTSVADIVTAYLDGKSIQGRLHLDLSENTNVSDYIVTGYMTVMDVQISNEHAMAAVYMEVMGLDDHIGVMGMHTGSNDTWQVARPSYMQKSQVTNSYSANNATISYLADPVNNTDAANKQYVDTQVSGVSVPVQDVQVNGTSILSNGVANIPIMSGYDAYGLPKTQSGKGIYVTSTGILQIAGPTAAQYKGGINDQLAVKVNGQHHAVFYGLAKAAGYDEKDSTESLGTYTDGAKQAIQNMLGITSLLSTEEAATATAAHTANSLFLMGGKLYKATSTIAIGDAVEAGTNCQIVKADEVFIKNTDYATADNAGIIKVNSNSARGLAMNSGFLCISNASTANIKAGTDAYKPITPNHTNDAVYYGLSKAAGIDLASETVTVGTYPTTAATAIKTMLQVQEGLEVVKLI